MSWLMKSYVPFLLVIISTTTCFGADLIPVSRPSRVSITAAGNSFGPQFSADGRYVFFASHAKNLATNALLSLSLNIYRYDTVTGETILVSTSSDGAHGGDGDSTCYSV